MLNVPERVKITTHLILIGYLRHPDFFRRVLYFPDFCYTGIMFLVEQPKYFPKRLIQKLFNVFGQNIDPKYNHFLTPDDILFAIE